MVTHRALCVLVVDDCRDQLDTLALLLKLWGHRPLVASDGPTAVNLALAHRPDVVLLDLGLPGRMDGYKVARQLRACPATATTRLVALTGFGQETDRRRTVEAGFHHFLLKPSEPEQLKKLLDANDGWATDGIDSGLAYG
jgi:two-component system CheB/CheR fusion protein